MTKIVVCGAGFGGLTAALELEKRFKHQKNIFITLLDKRAYHLFSPSLYEVATAEEEMTSVSQLEQSVVLPLRDLLAGKKINFYQAEVTSIDRQRRKVKAGIREIGYDYLVLAMGSKTEYFGIEGASKYALPLKTLPDALRLRNALEFAVEARRQEVIKPYVRVVVAGGGYTGVELAAEIAGLVSILAWKNSYPREKIEVMVVEGANQLVPGFDAQASSDMHDRLTALGVRVKLLSPIFKVDRHFVELVTGERVAYDVLAWTTGVRAQECTVVVAGECNRRGQFATDEFLRMKGDHRVFVVGDIACVRDDRGAAVPTTAQAAIAEGRYVAASFPLWLRNRKPRPFRLSKHPFLVSAGGKWALFRSDRFYVTGWLSYLLRLGANARYYAPLVGWRKAVKYALFQAELYGRND